MFSSFRYPYSIRKVLKDLKTRSAAYWEKQGEDMALKFFSYVQREVPAYKKYLGSKKKRYYIREIDDFVSLPFTSKTSYIKKYPFIDLFPKRRVSSLVTFSATSGSTGEPVFFPRGNYQDYQYEYIAEVVLRNQFYIHKKSSLVLLGFGMGIWIGGVFTYRVLAQLAQKGYSISVVPVGPDISLFIKTLKKFGHLYDQVILAGYPPFIKDIVDEAKDFGIRWGKYSIRILTATESFSEEFREYIASKVKLENPVNDFVNIYGTVELGTMAHETGMANLIRLHVLKNKELSHTLFSDVDRLPTLAQYHPYLTYFEQVGEEVIGTGYGSGIPLIRYRFPDRGGVIRFEDMVALLHEFDIDILNEMKSRRIEQTLMRLPFVYVYERADHTIVVRGVNLYSDHIKRALDSSKLHNVVTGKFTMIKKEDRNLNEYFELHVEMKKGVKKNVQKKKKVQLAVVDFLLKNNSEFADQYRSASGKIIPRVYLWPYHHDKYFRQGGKQRWSL